MAPLIIPTDKSAPKNTVLGTNNKIPVASSATPVAILPKGSTPSLEKIYTLSGAAVNLKNKVCNKMHATTMRKINFKVFIVFMFNFFNKISRQPKPVM